MKKIIAIIAAVAFLVGYGGGYWHGRMFELYESAKRYGAVPATMTWEEFLKKP